jgi:phage gp45-like
MNPITLIKNLFKIAKLLSVDDSGDYQFMTVKTLGKTQKVMSFKPYGLMSNPPVDSIVSLLSQQGQESNGIGTADDPKNRPIKNMKTGEVAVGNYITGDYLYFDADGSFHLLTVAGNSDITTNKLAIVAPDVSTTGNLSVGSGDSGVFTSLLGQVITAADGVIVDIT